MNRWRRGVAATLAGVVGVALPATSALAAGSPEDGLWYYDLANIDEIHEAGVTGEGVTVAVIDSPVNLEVPTLQDANLEVQPSPCLDEAGQPVIEGTSDDHTVAAHGTQMASVIAGTGAGYEGQTGVKGLAPGARVLTYANNFSDEIIDVEPDECPGSESAALAEAWDSPTAIALSIVAAVDAGADIINCSFITTSDSSLDYAVAYALRHDVIVVAGVPNEGFDFTALGGDAPHSLNGVVTVNLGDRDGSTPPRWDGVDIVAPGVDILQQGYEGDWNRQALADGTSEATAYTSGALALAMSAHPEATHNQILQSLIHNTGFEDHDLAYRQEFGYGTLVPQRLVDSDPSQYEDINPFISNYTNQFPLVSAIWPGAVASEEYPPDFYPYPAYTPEPGVTSAPSDSVASPDATATPTADSPSAAPTAQAADSDASSTPGWVVPVVIAVIAVVALVVVVAIVLSRSQRRAGDSHEH